MEVDMLKLNGHKPIAQDEKSFFQALEIIEQQKRIPDRDEYGDCGSLNGPLDELIEAHTEDGEEGYHKAKIALFNATPRLMQLAATSVLESEPDGFTTKDGKRVFVTFSEDDIEALPDIQWLVAGMLQQQTVSLLAGNGNTGKTFIALDLAMHIARGMDWLGRRVSPGAVLYVYAEGKLGLKSRLQAWRRRYNRPSSPHMRFIPRPAHLKNDAAYLCNTIEALAQRPVLLIIDTFSMCTSGMKENDNTEVAQHIETARTIKEKYGCHVMIIHHSGKNGEIRGASALRDNTDTVLLVSRDEEEGPITVRCDKQRDSGYFPNFYLQLQEEALGLNKYGEPVTSCIITQAVNIVATPDRLTRIQATVLKALEVILSKDHSARYTEWMGIADSFGVKKSGFDKARAALIKKCFVDEKVVDGHKVYNLRDTTKDE
jgi:hypothetical protein